MKRFMNQSMKKYLITFIIFGFLTAMFAGCGQTTTPPDDNGNDVAEPVELTVAAAASLTDVMEEIAELYKEESPETTLDFTFGGSGALQTQIEEGAPVDVFISAAQTQMNALEEGGLIQTGTRKDILINKVVLIVPQSSDKDIETFQDVATDKVEKVALGEPESVPVGQYSQAIYTSLGLLGEVEAKAVYASDVREVLSWVESGEVDCGIVYSTDAATSDQITVVTEAPEGSHDPVIYPAALIEGISNTEAAQAFLDFLSTTEIKALFESYGFDTV